MYNKLYYHFQINFIVTGMGLHVLHHWQSVLSVVDPELTTQDAKIPELAK